MNLEIKICGLQTPATIEAAIENGANYIGFIFFPKSPRHLEIGKAKLLRPLITKPVKLVAVTVDADDTLIEAIVSQVKPDMLQLHGHETPERVAELKERYGLDIIKAFSVCQQSDFNNVKAYRGIADMFLFDAKAPKNSQLPGGNGVCFDWSLMKSLDVGCKTMLSGGLDAKNVGHAIAVAQPSVIDISSGVETAPGIKDVNLIKGFFGAVKKAVSH